MIKLADTLQPMADFPSAYAKDIAFDDGDTLQEKLDTGSLGGGGAGYKQLSQAEYDALTDDEKMDGREYRTYDTGHIYKLGIEYGKDNAVYTSLAELGLDNTATIDDVRGALKVGESCMIRTDAFADLTQFNGIQWGYLKITVTTNKMSDIWLNDVTSPNGLYYGRQSSGKFDKWVGVSTQRTYTELVQLGLTADATVDDVLSKLQAGETFISGVSQFTNYQTLFPYKSSNDQYSRVFIQQGTSLATAYIKWFRKDGSREALANLDGNNKIRGWNEHTTNEIIYTSLTESLSGITTTLDLINALITEYRAKQKPVRFISGNITKTTFADLPQPYGVLTVLVAGYDVIEVTFAQSNYGFKNMYYGFVNRASSETLFSSLTWEKQTNNIILDTTYEDSDTMNVQLTHYGFYKFGAPTKGAPSNGTGDYVLLNIPWHTASGSSDESSMLYATQILFSPRYSSRFWMRRVWGYKTAEYTYVEGDYSVFSEWKTHTYINDNASSDYTVYSSKKINELLTETFNGKEVKTVTIDLSASDLNDVYSGLNKMKLDNYLNGSVNVIKAEGYYIPPSDASGYAKTSVQAYKNQEIGNIFFEMGSWKIGVAGSEAGKKGSGFVKIYYVE